MRLLPSPTSALSFALVGAIAAAVVGIAGCGPSELQVSYRSYVDQVEPLLEQEDERWKRIVAMIKQRQDDAAMPRYYKYVSETALPYYTEFKTAVDAGFPSALYSTRFGVDWSLVRSAWSDRASLFVIAGWNDPTMNLCAFVRRLRGLPYWVWTDTPDSSWVPRSRLKSWLRARWLRWMLGGASRVWGTGAVAMERLIALGSDADRTHDLPYVIDLDRYDRPRPPRAERLRMGTAGQIVPRKDLPTALEACAKLVERGRRDFVFEIVGTGTEEDALKARVEALGLGDHVRFLGWLEGDALLDFFGGIDLYVHPCEFEPWGVVVMEAMASGTPVVCSDQTFCAVDWVVPGESGLLFETWNAEALASRLEEALADRVRLESWGAEAKRVARSWPPSRAVEAIESFADEPR